MSKSLLLTTEHGWREKLLDAQSLFQKRSVEAAIEFSREVVAFRDFCSKKRGGSDFSTLATEWLGCDRSTLSRFVAIGERADELLGMPNSLPSDTDSLARICSLPDIQFQEAMKCINPDMKRQEIRDLIGEVNGKGSRNPSDDGTEDPSPQQVMKSIEREYDDFVRLAIKMRPSGFGVDGSETNVHQSIRIKHSTDESMFALRFLRQLPLEDLIFLQMLLPAWIGDDEWRISTGLPAKGFKSSTQENQNEGVAMATNPKPKPEPAIAANDAEVRPVPLSVIAEGIPQSMKDRKQWVCWSYVQKNGKWTKPPFSASGDFASSTKPETWATFDAALSSYKTKHHDGIGFVLAEGDGLAGIDLDHCINDGQLSEEAQEIVDQFQDAAYIERSPGGDGVRLFVLGSHRRSGKGKDKWVEVYDFRSPRYLTVTGHRMGVQEAPQECPEGLEWLHEHYLKDEIKTDAIKAEKTTPHCAGPEEDEALINRMRSFKNQGQKFVSLFYNATHYNDDGEIINDESAADMALVELLAFACCRDEFQMDRIFRQSALMRDKWDNKHSADGRTYGQMTIGKALKYNEDKGGKTLKAFDAERSHKTGDTTKGKAPYTLLTFEDLKASGHALELVENVLPASGTACIYGQSGAGKTFLALNLMMAISGGDPTWFGYNVMQRPVIYFGLEGMQGFKDRLEAHCMHEFNDPPSDDFRAVDDQFNLIDSLDHKRLIDAVRSVGFKDPVVVIDTMTRATPGLDLNGPADMGLVIEAVSKIQRQLGGLIIVIYHSTSKTNGSNSTELGHSSFRGSLDASIFVHSDESGAKSWSLVKSKDAEDGKSHPFVLVPYEVRRNQWGNPKMSCAVEVPQSVDSGRTMPENMALGKLMADYISEKWNGNPRHYFSKDQLIDSARPDGMSRSKAVIAFSYLQLNKLIELRELPQMKDKAGAKNTGT